MRDQHGECWACKRKPEPVLRTQADDYTMLVHHVHPLRVRPDLALSDFDESGNPNLVVLCDSCHWDMHHQRRAVEIPERW